MPQPLGNRHNIEARHYQRSSRALSIPAPLFEHARESPPGFRSRVLAAKFALAVSPAAGRNHSGNARIRAALPTIELLLDSGAALILCSVEAARDLGIPEERWVYTQSGADAKDGKYPASYAAALTAVTAVIAPIIPPSIPMVLVGVVNELSVGRLFFGGVIPGLLMTAGLMALIYWQAIRRSFPHDRRATLREVLCAAWRAFLPMMTPVIILGGMMGGLFTPRANIPYSAPFSR